MYACEPCPRSPSPASSRRFGSSRALDGLDLEVAEGEVHGFLGPNGAGKSTTIRVLLGLLRADAGRRAARRRPWRDATALHRRLAYVPGDVTLWPNLSGGEAIDLLGRLRGGLDEQRRAELLERFELDPTKKGRAYSKGNRQKVALVAALGVRRRAADPRRADLGPGPADGGGLPRVRRRRARARPHGPALDPHPVRGRGAVRPRDDHPHRPDRRDRHAGRAAPPDPDHDRGRDRRRPAVPSRSSPPSCRRRSSASCSAA